jgi:hypothetical protein
LVGSHVRHAEHVVRADSLRLPLNSNVRDQSMTPQQLVGIGVRLFALWLALSSVSYLVTAPASLQASAVPGGPTFAYAVGGAYLVGAVLVWSFPMWVAGKLIPRTSFQNHMAVQALELARVGCCLLGVWLLAKTLPTLVWFLARAVLLAGNSSAFSALGPEARVDMAVALFEVAFAVVLTFRSSTVARLVVRE